MKVRATLSSSGAEPSHAAPTKVKWRKAFKTALAACVVLLTFYNAIVFKSIHDGLDYLIYGDPELNYTVGHTIHSIPLEPTQASHTPWTAASAELRLLHRAHVLSMLTLTGSHGGGRGGGEGQGGDTKHPNQTRMLQALERRSQSTAVAAAAAAAAAAEVTVAASGRGSDAGALASSAAATGETGTGSGSSGGRSSSSSDSSSGPQSTPAPLTVVELPCGQGPSAGTALPAGSVAIWACQQYRSAAGAGAGSDVWALGEVYSHMDSIAGNLRAAQARVGQGTLVVWAAGPLLTSARHADSDEALLALYLSLNHLVLQHGFVVLPVQANMAQALLLQLLAFVPDELRSKLLGTGGGVASLSPLPLGPPAPELASSRVLQSRCQPLLYTRKYDEICMPYPAELYPALVAGMGGAGTHAVSQLLQTVGAKLYHERIGRHGAVSWTYAVNDAYIGKQYPWGRGEALSAHVSSVLSPRFRKVFHLVREPLAHISSFAGHKPSSYDFVASSLAKILPEAAATRAAEKSSGGAIAIASYAANINIRLECEDSSEAVKKRLASMAQARVEQTEGGEEEEQGRASGGRSSVEVCERGGMCNVPFAAFTYVHWNQLIYPQTQVHVQVQPGVSGTSEAPAHTAHITYQIDQEAELLRLVQDVCDLLALTEAVGAPGSAAAAAGAAVSVCDGAAHRVEVPPKGRSIEHVVVERTELHERDSWPDVVTIAKRNRYAV